MVAFVFTTVIWLAALLLSVPSRADNLPYTGTRDIKVEDDLLIVEHHHHWYGAKLHTMMSTHQDPFRSDNDYAHIRCTDKRTGEVLWQKPTVGLTYLHITADSQHIIGLSKVKVMNPFQLVIYDREGNLLMKKHIAREEIRMTDEELNEFCSDYSLSRKQIEPYLLERNDSVYFDYTGAIASGAVYTMAMWDWGYLSERMHPSHLSPNFSESVTNWIYWFDESNPSPQLHFTNGTLSAISLNDPKGIRFEIPAQ